MKRKSESGETKNTKRKKSLSIKEKMKYCAGCYNNIYNFTDDNGNKQYCWLLRSAEVVERNEVHMSQIPPFHKHIVVVNNCYRRPNYVHLEPDNTGR